MQRQKIKYPNKNYKKHKKTIKNKIKDFHSTRFGGTYTKDFHIINYYYYLIFINLHMQI